MRRHLQITASVAVLLGGSVVPAMASTPVEIIVPLEFKSLDPSIVGARVACATFSDPLTKAESADKASLADAFEKKAGRADFPPGTAPIVDGKAEPPTMTFSYRVPASGEIPKSFICAISSFTRKDGTQVGTNAKPVTPGAPYISIVGGEFPKPGAAPSPVPSPASR